MKAYFQSKVIFPVLTWTKLFCTSWFASAVLVFGVLFALDFPKPTIDDLFFTGASLHLAQGNDFSNPLLERQKFPSQYFFMQPPVYSFALAGWLKFWGISAICMIGFQWLLYLVICAATQHFLRVRGFSLGKSWLIPLGVLAAFLPEGLRSEAFCVAEVMAGLWILEAGSTSTLRMFVGGMVLLLGASASPRLIFFSGAIGLIAIGTLRTKGVSWTKLFWLFVVVSLGNLTLFGLMIDLRFKEFFETYLFHARGRISSDKVSAGLAFLKGLSVIQWPLVLFAVGSLVISLIWSKWRRGSEIMLSVSVAIICSLAAGVLGHGALWYLFLVALVFTTAVGSHFKTTFKNILACLFVLTLVSANIRVAIYAYGMMTNKIKSTAGLAAVDTLETTGKETVLLDGAAARYVFDYRLPSGFLDWNFSSRFPGSLPTDEPLRVGDVYLVGPDNIRFLEQKTPFRACLSQWRPFGLGKSFHEFPRQIHLIRAADCGATGESGSKPQP